MKNICQWASGRKSCAQWKINQALAASLSSSYDSVQGLPFYRRRDCQTPDKHRKIFLTPFHFLTGLSC